MSSLTATCDTTLCDSDTSWPSWLSCMRQRVVASSSRSLRSVLRLGGARHASGCTELAPELGLLIHACATIPARSPVADEAVNARARGELLDALAELSRSADGQLHSASVGALTSLLHPPSWPGSAKVRLPPSQSMAVALAQSSVCAPDDALACLAEAQGEARLRGACTVLVNMMRASARVRRRLLDGGAPAVLMRVLTEALKADRAAARVAERGMTSNAQTAEGTTVSTVSLSALSARSTASSTDQYAVDASRAMFGNSVHEAAANVVHAPSLDAREGGGSDDDEDTPPPSEPDEPQPSPRRLPRSTAAGRTPQRPAAPAEPRVSSRARQMTRQPGRAPGAAGPVSAVAQMLIDLISRLCIASAPCGDDAAASSESDAEGLARAGREALVGVGALGTLSDALGLSLSGGRSDAEKRLRLDLIGALTALASLPHGPAQLRESGALPLLCACVSGSEVSRTGRARGLFGGTRTREDAQLLSASMLLCRQCCAADPSWAATMWTDEALVVTLCAAIDSIGVSPASASSILRPGSTRAVLAYTSEVTLVSVGGRGGGSLGGAMLTGWPAALSSELSHRALEVAGEMTSRAPASAIAAPPPSPTRAAAVAARVAQKDPAAMAEAATEQRRQTTVRISERLAATVSAAVSRQVGSPLRQPPPPMLSLSLRVLTRVASVAPAALAMYPERRALLLALLRHAIAVNSSPAAVGGFAGSASRLPAGATEAAGECMLALSAACAADVDCALELCRASAITSLISGLRMPWLSQGTPHDARLTLRAVDLLHALSADDRAPTWPHVTAQVGSCGGVGVLLESLGTASHAVLPPVISLLADWMRHPELRAEFRNWVAPPGLLVREAEAEGGGAGGSAGADALRLVLRAWQAAETNAHAAPLVRQPKLDSHGDLVVRSRGGTPCSLAARPSRADAVYILRAPHTPTSAPTCKGPPTRRVTSRGVAATRARRAVDEQGTARPGEWRLRDDCCLAPACCAAAFARRRASAAPPLWRRRRRVLAAAAACRRGRATRCRRGVR